MTHEFVGFKIEFTAATIEAARAMVDREKVKLPDVLEWEEENDYSLDSTGSIWWTIRARAL